MKVIPLQETINRDCVCGITLVAGVEDIEDNCQLGCYGFTCPKCGRFHKVDFNSLSKGMKAVIGRRETGH